MKWNVTGSVIASIPAPARFANLAENFCRRVDGFADYEPADWLAFIARELGPLESMLKELAEKASIIEYSILVNIEQRHHMFVELKTFLGAMDDYFTVADLEVGDGVMTGSLADDVTEIYFALKRGLFWWNEGVHETDRAVAEWVTGFDQHWGYHLANLKSQLKHKATLH